MEPTVGRIVHYRFSDEEIEDVNNVKDFGYVNFNDVVDREYAMIIVSVWTPECVSGQVFLDGDIFYHAKSVYLGDKPGQWSWPPRI